MTIGGRAELVCRPASPELRYRSIVWSKANGTPLPSTASGVNSQTLVISNVRADYQGDYVCTIVTEGGVTGTGISSLVIIVDGRCPPGYDNPPRCDICATGYYRDTNGRCVERQGNTTLH